MNNLNELLLIGCGGHAKSVVDSIEQKGEYKIAGFIDKKNKFGYKGYEVLGDDEMLQSLYADGIRHAFVAIGFMGTSGVRRAIFHRLQSIGFFIPNIIDGTAIMAQDVIMGGGNYIGKGVILNADVKIGDMCIINTGAILEHECEVKSFTHISVGTVLCGNVKVGEETLVGANSVVIQEKSIGKGCIIGAGAIIHKNVQDKHVVYTMVKNKDILIDS